MLQSSLHRFLALVFAVVFPLGFLPAREGPAPAAGTGPSIISTSSSEFDNFLFDVRLVDEAASVAVLLVVPGAAKGSSTSITVGSPELEFDSRGRGGGCKGLDRAEDAIDGFVDFVLCERTEEVGEGLRE